MRAKLLWTAAAGGIYAGVVLAGGSGADAPLPFWLSGAAYFILGVALLGAVARWWAHGVPALWRPFMLAAGSLLAAAEIAWRPGNGGQPVVDQWMAALLGLLLAAILARMVPDRVSVLWFAIDRRASRRARS